MSRLACFAGLALCCLILAGCGPKGPVRHEISGKVTLRNEPIDEGIIDFHPLDEQGTKSGATIMNGEYEIPKDKGLFPGRYRVTIIAGDGTSGGGLADPNSPKKRSRTPGKERVPPQYNEKSDLVREVKADEANTFNFAIP